MQSAGEVSDLHHFKILFAGAAFGASPVDGDVLPAGAGRDAFVGRALFLVVKPAANLADISAVGNVVFAHRWDSTRKSPAASTLRLTHAPPSP